MVSFAYVGHIKSSVLFWNCYITIKKLLVAALKDIIWKCVFCVKHVIKQDLKQNRLSGLGWSRFSAFDMAKHKWVVKEEDLVQQAASYYCVH